MKEVTTMSKIMGYGRKRINLFIFMFSFPQGLSLLDFIIFSHSYILLIRKELNMVNMYLRKHFWFTIIFECAWTITE